MQTRPNVKHHDDLKVIISAVALTLTLAFWNIFSNGAPKPVQAANNERSVPQTIQGKILLGGPPPKTTIIVSRPSGAQQQVQQRAPQPITNTASSK